MEFLAVAGRLGIGLLLLVAGIAKFRRPADFAEALQGYQVAAAAARPTGVSRHPVGRGRHRHRAHRWFATPTSRPPGLFASVADGNGDGRRSPSWATHRLRLPWYSRGRQDLMAASLEKSPAGPGRSFGGIRTGHSHLRGSAACFDVEHGGHGACGPRHRHHIRVPGRCETDTTSLRNDVTADRAGALVEYHGDYRAHDVSHRVLGNTRACSRPDPPSPPCTSTSRTNPGLGSTLTRYRAGGRVDGAGFHGLRSRRPTIIT